MKLDPLPLAFLPLDWQSYLNICHLHRGAHLAHLFVFRFGLQPSYVEKIAINAVPDDETSITILENIHEHGR